MLADEIIAARKSELLRLGIVPGGVNRTTRDNVGAVPLDNLILQSGYYLDDMVLCNKPATIAAKRAAYAKLFRYLEERGHETCGEREIRGFLSYVKNAHLQDGGRWGRAVSSDAESARFVRPVGARTVEYYFVYIRALYRWLLECEIIERDPTAKIKIEKPDAPLILPFDEDQVRALHKAALASNHPERDAAIIKLMYDTGLRASELCGMTLTCLEMKPSNGFIKVVGKGDKPRIVPFAKDALKALRVYLRTNPPRAGLKLWTSRCGKRAGDPLNPNGLLQLYHRLGQAARISGVRCSPHTMRHTFAINYLRRSNGDITSLQVLMGHEKIETTMRYLHIVETDIIANHQKFSPADGLEW